MPIGSGVTVGHAQGRITLDISQPQLAAAAMRGIATQIEQDFRRVDQSSRQAAGGSNELAAAFGGLIKGGIAAYALHTAKQIAGMGLELAQTTARADQMAQRFEILAKISNTSAEEMMDTMRKASRNHISDTELMYGANRAMLLGVARNMEDMQKLMRVAGSLSGAMGLSFSEGFDIMIRGIGRLDPMILDNLGLMVNAEQTYKAYGATIGKTAGELTALEKRQAFFNEVMQQSEKLVEAHLSKGVSDAGRFQQAAAATENLRVALGRTFSKDVVWWVQRYTEALNTATGAVNAYNQARENKNFTASKGMSGTERYAVGMAAYVSFQEARYRAMWEDTKTVYNWLDKTINTPVNRARYALGITDINPDAPAVAQAGNLPQVGAYARDAYLNLPAARTTVRSPRADRYDADQDARILEWNQTTREIERNAYQARIDTTRQYEEQRSNVIRTYEQNRAREAEDFARQRARAEADFARSVDQIRRDAARQEQRRAADLAREIAQSQADSAERVAEWEADRAKAAAELRQAGNERLAELEKDYQKTREQAAEDHRDRLLDAAGRLDAVAVRQEEERYAKESARAEEAHQEQVDELNQGLQKQLEQLDEAHQERLEDEAKALAKRNQQARDAFAREQEETRADNERRIEEMKVEFQRRKDEEDADRALRLEREAADHQAQLDEMARQQALNLQQISDNAQEARDRNDAEFQKDLEAMGIRTAAYKAQHDQQERDAQAAFARFWQGINTRLAGPLTLAESTPAFPTLGGLADNSYIIPPSGSVATKGGSVIISSGAITIYGAAGQSEEEIGRIVEEKLYELMEDAS